MHHGAAWATARKMSLLYLKDVLSTLTAKHLVLESHEHQVKQLFHAA